jgi:type I restriction enzyme S subunit
MIRAFEMPFPRLTEQHHIVAEMDAVITICDRFEASLTTTTTTNRARLLGVHKYEPLRRKTEAAT